MNDSTSQIRYEDLASLAEKLMPAPRHSSSFANPAALTALRAETSAWPDHSVVTAYGIPVFSSPFVPLHPKKWQFPSDPFTEYEASDEAWARPVRYGREVDDKSRMIVYAMSRYWGLP